MNIKEQHERHEWVKSLAVGDKCCYREYGSYGSSLAYLILTVQRMTATQLVCTNAMGREVRVRRNDGHVIGNSYRSIEPVTDKVLAYNDEANLRNWASSFAYTLSREYKKLPIDVLRAVKDAYEKETQNKEAA